jgi:DNA repair protein RecO (recombination protein O)
MSHTKYTTEALVLRGFDVGESDRYFSLLTKDMGLVQAQARGVRHIKSKQRYALQSLSRSQISLVRGKSKWRITNVTSLEQISTALTKECLMAFTRVLHLIDRLIKGEEANESLYTILLNGYEYARDKNIKDKDVTYLEVLLILLALENLGYLEKDKFKNIFATPVFDEEKLVSVARVYDEAVYEINHSLEASQL